MADMSSGNRNIRGVTLIDVLVGTAIFSMVFITLLTSFQAAAEFANRNRLRANALSIANDHLETIRALPYDSIGTVSGLPWGTIPQTQDVTYDGKQYSLRTFIQYVDDPADGTGVADSLAADYKRIKAEVSYEYHDETASFSLVTTVAPPSQEALAGAGVLQLLVKDASNNPVSDATLHVFNDTIATTVDITTFTNANGAVSLPGAWAGDGYEITISKSGYSGAQTYDATVSNPAPSPGHANVLVGQVMELIFKIDLLSRLSVLTRALPTRGLLDDDFADDTQLSALTSTEVTAGGLVLTGGPAAYAPTGQATSVTIAPASLGSWLLFSWTDTVPVGTEARYHVLYNNAGTYELVPDADLPGNSAGFTDSPLDIGVLDSGTYPDLQVRAVFTSTDAGLTPALTTWHVSYMSAPAALPGIGFSLQGLKTIGTSPVQYKYSETHTTDGTGAWVDDAMEWDEYTLALTTAGYQVAEGCPSLPVSLDPGTDVTQVLTLAPDSSDALRLTVLDPFGGIVPRAEVRVVGGAVDTTAATGACGVAYVPNLANDTYTVTVSAAGFAPFSASVPVDGITDQIVTLSL